MSRAVLFFLIFFSLCGVVFPMEITVAKAGGDYTTIQAALNSAGPGDTITVRAGVYYEKLTIPTSGNAASGYITLRAYPGESVILDGQGVSGKNMLYMKNKDYIKIAGFEIRNNLNVSDGSGIRLEGYGDFIEIRDCKIHAIRGTDAMGITVYGTSATPISHLVITGNEIYDCDPAHSEALTLNGNINGFTVSANVVHDVNNIGIDFIGGESLTANYDPGLIQEHKTKQTLLRGVQGGGFLEKSPPGRRRQKNNLIASNNSAARNGICSGNTVYQARSSYGGGYAAGIYVDGGQDIVIEHNRVYECDLGIEIGAENPGFNSTGIIVRSNIVYHNDKTGIVFGGYEKSVGRTKDCYFYNNVLYQNDTLRDGNGELWIQYAENNVIENNIIYCGPQNLLLASEAGNINNTLDYNLWYASAGQGQVKFFRNGTQYNGWQAYLNGTSQDAHSIFIDPGFVDVSHENFHLRLTSAAIDAGDPAYKPGSDVLDIDGQSRLINGRVDLGADEIGVPTVTAPNGGENWPVGSTQTITWNSGETGSNVTLRFSTDNGVNWATIIQSTANDGAYLWTVPGTPSANCLVSIAYVLNQRLSDTADTVFFITGSGLQPELQLSRTHLYFGVAAGNAASDPQTVLISNKGGGSLAWSIAQTIPWLSGSPSSGTGNGTVIVSIDSTGLAAGTYTGSLTVSDLNAANSPQSVSVTLKVYGPGLSAPPFGSFDTPREGTAGVTGAIPVTGWAVDDIEVESVKIFRGDGAALIYIGEAVMVEGARPDVEQAYPGFPFNYKAGWGYMMLTNFLPNGGNGTFTLYAVARDKEGHDVTLGSKTFSCDNAGAVKPFGALDTPRQGGTAAGSGYINWGWVLTPQPNRIPTGGSTLNVFVDGVNLGHPVYNIYRSDIAGLFPGYANSAGAAGYFYLDTTSYADGIHTIQWTAVDDAGNRDGIGSRYFTVQNSDPRQPAAGSNADNGFGLPGNFPEIPAKSDDLTPLRFKRGYDLHIEPQELYPDENGNMIIKVKELERVVIYNDRESSTGKWQGCQVIGDRLRPLPVGSTLEPVRGIFYWQPGPGFSGSFDLLFIDKEKNTGRKITIKILPGESLKTP
jgi:hypothetical protein